MGANPDKFAFDPPPTNIQDVSSFQWKTWFNRIYGRIGNYVFGLNGLSKANLPNAADWGSNIPTMPFSGIVYVYDEVGGPTLAFSDGTNWRRVQDRNIVS
jgi:hypothetical protein